MVVHAGAAGHQTVAEVDQAAQGHVRKQHRLLKPDAVPERDMLFQQRAGADMRAGSGIDVVKQGGVIKKSAPQPHARAKLAVLEGDRSFLAKHTAGADCQRGTVETAAGMNLHSHRNALRHNLRSHAHRFRPHQPYAAFLQGRNLSGVMHVLVLVPVR